MTRLQPVHPGEVLKHGFMEPFGLSATTLARATNAREEMPGQEGAQGCSVTESRRFGVEVDRAMGADLAWPE